MLRTLASRTASQLGLRTAVASSVVAPLAVRGFASVVEGLKYAKSHEWVKVEGGVGTVGITDHAQAELGDIVYVELPEVGAKLTAGKTFGVVESVKAASDVYSPVSGEVVEVNTQLADNSALVNKSAFKDGWMMKVKIANPADLNKLLDAKAYDKHCQEGGH